MKRLLIALAILSSFLLSDGFDKEIGTIARFSKFRQTLIDSSKQGDPSSAFMLGVLYMQTHRLQDGVIGKNEKAAIHYFFEALHGGYSLASLYLSFLLPPQEGIKTLEFALTHQTPPIQVLNRYLQIVLERFYKDKKQLAKSCRICQSLIDERTNPQTRFLYAHLLFAAGEKKRADYQLNKACTAKDATSQLRTLCMVNPLAEIRDESGNLVHIIGDSCDGK